jgi:IclR family transcriptional regulator, KDG regulon repressor
MSSVENVKSVERAFQILNCFTLEKPEMGITELSKILKVSKSTIHRLITSMQKQGFIMQNNVNQQYRLGFGILRLSEIVLKNVNIRTIALPILQDLRDKTGESAGLNIISNITRVCIEKAESYHGLRRFIEIGEPLPLYAGASGKVLLAYQTEAFIQEILKGDLRAFTEKTVTDPTQIMRELKAIKERGYCITVGENAVGATSISAPVFDHNREVVASINISGPTARFTPDKNSEFLKILLDAAKSISYSIGLPQGL